MVAMTLVWLQRTVFCRHKSCRRSRPPTLRQRRICKRRSKRFRAKIWRLTLTSCETSSTLRSWKVTRVCMIRRLLYRAAYEATRR